MYGKETYGSDTTFYVASSLDDVPTTLPGLTQSCVYGVAFDLGR